MNLYEFVVAYVTHRWRDVGFERLEEFDYTQYDFRLVECHVRVRIIRILHRVDIILTEERAPNKHLAPLVSVMTTVSPTSLKRGSGDSRHNRHTKQYVVALSHESWLMSEHFYSNWWRWYVSTTVEQICHAETILTPKWKYMVSAYIFHGSDSTLLLHISVHARIVSLTQRSRNEWIRQRSKNIASVFICGL